MDLNLSQLRRGVPTNREALVPVLGRGDRLPCWPTAADAGGALPTSRVFSVTKFAAGLLHPECVMGCKETESL